MPKINLTERQLEQMEKYLPADIMQAIDEQILANSIPAKRQIEVPIQCQSGMVKVTGQQIDKSCWAIVPLLKHDDTLHRTQRTLTHTPSGLFLLSGFTKNQLLAFWAKMPNEIKASIQDEEDKTKIVSEALGDYVMEYRSQH